MEREDQYNRARVALMGSHVDPAESEMDARMQEWLSTVAYKPRWTFTLCWIGDKMWNRQPLLTVTYPVIDVDTGQPGVAHRTLALGSAWELLGDDIKKWFFEMVWVAICTAEDHESKEWFVVDGVRVKDPHA